MSISIINPDKFENKPNAVLFDLDNTLYDYATSHQAGMSAIRDKATQKIGVELSQFNESFDKARDEVKNQLGKTASSHSRLLYFQRTLENLKLRSQVLLSLELEQTYWGSFLAATELREGVLDFLDQLALAGIPKILVTDLTAQIQFRKLVYLELDKRFEYVVTSEESGNDKPHPSGFELALSKLVSLCPDAPSKDLQIWMIGDNIVSDIEGAKNSLNASTIAIKSELGDHANNPAIDMTIETFKDLEKFLSSKGWIQTY